jgi:hypothetical protein
MIRTGGVGGHLPVEGGVQLFWFFLETSVPGVFAAEMCASGR